LRATAARPDVRLVIVTHVVAKNDEGTLVARSLRSTWGATW